MSSSEEDSSEADRGAKRSDSWKVATPGCTSRSASESDSPPADVKAYLDSLLEKTAVGSSAAALSLACCILMESLGFKMLQSGHIDWTSKASGHHFQYSHSQTPELNYSLRCIPFSHMLIVTANSSQRPIKISCELRLVIADFVSIAPSCSSSISGQFSYRDLESLHVKMRDDIGFTLLRDAIRRTDDDPSNLLSLPNELLLMIVSQLNASEICKLGCVCKTLFVLCRAGVFWKPLYRQRWGDEQLAEQEHSRLNWYLEYKSKYLRRERLQKELGSVLRLRSLGILMPPINWRRFPPGFIR